MNRTASQGHLVLIAATLVSAVLGSIHAFSVFLAPLENSFEISRATASLTYSIGLVCLTVLVLFGPSVYARLRPATIYIVVSILGTIGAITAGIADSIAVVWVGYGVIFGIANGLGYGFGLQFAARANPKSPGFAMGLVTAAYAVGAALAPYLFELALNSGGFRLAMLSLAAAVFITGIGAALIVSLSQTSYSSTRAEAVSYNLPFVRIALIWTSYGAAVFAGLMAIGHAASLATAAGFTGWVAPALLACFNFLGSLFSGLLVDRTSKRQLLMVLQLISAISLAGLAVLPELTLLLLCLIGFAYGGTIAAYPAAISQLFPGNHGPTVYGRVFTAWGMAGLLAPWIAGRIFDRTGAYDAALWTACALAVLSALVALKSIDAQRNANA